MIFTQAEFILFFAVVWAFVLLVRDHGRQKFGLLAASVYFYAYWDWRFLGLIAACTGVNWLAAAGMARSQAPPVRKALLGLALGASLGTLGFFKYYNFFIDSLGVLLGTFGLRVGTLRILLPVGISFHTFRALSYTLDVYRGQLRACRSLRDFALYVAFFPQLLAGPIVRAADFLPQLETPRRCSWRRTFRGGRQFVFGLFKKVFLADRCAGFVDYVFLNYAAFDGATIWLAVVAYALQIYCDFSGYSDMAIGSAHVLGYDSRLNFNLPYLARSVEDFWRRWHISLSTWLRDYVYIPLGGNRRGPGRTYVNVMVTMLLGGLWHGAAWTFVFWGAWHGAALAVQKYSRQRPGLARVRLRLATGAGGLGGWLLTMGVVLIGWVFFRAPDFPTAAAMLGRMMCLAPGVAWYHPFVLAAIGLLALQHAARAAGVRSRLGPTRLATPLVLLTMVWLVVVFYPDGFQPFIYLKF